MMQFPPFDVSTTMPDRRTAALTGGLDIYQKLLKALAMPEIMKTEQQQRMADLSRSNILNQFLPQQQQSQLDLQGSQIPLNQAQTGELQERTKLMPLQSATSAQNALNALANAQRLQTNRGPAWTLEQMLAKKSPGDRAVFQAENTGLIDKLTKQSLMQAQNELDRGGPQVPNVLTNKLLSDALGIELPQSQSPQSNNNMASMQQAQNVSPAITGSGLSGAPTGGNANLQLTPDEYKQAILSLSKYPDVNPGEPGQSESAMPQITIGDPNSSQNWTPTQRGQWSEMEAANRAATGPQIQNRKQAAIAFTNVLRNPQIQEALVKISDPKYSGMIGKSELYLKKHFQPAEVSEYNSIKERIHTLLSGSLKGVENIPTSNLGMERSSDFFKTVANDNAWVRDSQAQLKDTLTAMALADAESESIVQSSQPIYPTYKMPSTRPEILEKALEEAQGKQRVSKVLQGAGIAPKEATNAGSNKTYRLADGKEYTVNQLRRISHRQPPGSP